MAGCEAEGPRRPVGSTCSSAAACETGICGGGSCLSAEGDDDLDGLPNALEAVLGTDPTLRDTDGDTKSDFDETRGGFVVDSDEDGRPDAVESFLVDADGDCVPAELDPDESFYDPDLTGLVAFLCLDAGVCQGAARVVTCESGLPRCSYAAVPSWEAEEARCDGLDNDCDGATDEGYPDLDRDGDADCVDDDRDGDGTADGLDLCPDVADPLQADADGDGRGDACDPPDAPALVEITPASPSNLRTPTLTVTAEPRATVRLHAGGACAGAPLATGEVGLGGEPLTLTPTMPRNATTPLSARAENGAGLPSACVGLAGYTHDDLPPPPPAFAYAQPSSPSRLRRPTLTLAAPPTEKISRLRAYLDDDACAGPPAFDGPPATDGTASFTVLAPSNQPLAIHAIAVDAAGNASTCARIGTWRHDSLPPCPPRLADGRDAFGTSTPSVPLVAEPGGSVALYSDATCEALVAPAERVGTAQLAHDNCQALWRATVRLPADAPLPVWGLAVDAAGNVGTCSPVGALRRDTTPPAPPELLLVRATSWDLSRASFAGLGATEPGAAVEVHVGQSAGLDCAATPLHTATADGEGRFSFPLDLDVSSDQWLRLRARDVAGNPSDCTEATPLAGPLEIIVPPLAGPAALLVSDERGGVVSAVPLTSPATAPSLPQELRIVRGASISLAHLTPATASSGAVHHILTQADLEPFETITFGRGWSPADAVPWRVQVEPPSDSGAYTHLLVFECAAGHLESVELRTDLPAVVEVPNGCAASGVELEAWLRPASSPGPTATARWTPAAPDGTAQRLVFDAWQADTLHAVTVMHGGTATRSGLALLTARGDAAIAPQYWLELARDFRLEAGSTDATLNLPSILPPATATDAHMLLLMDFDLFGRIRLAQVGVPASAAGAPTIDADALLPPPPSLFTVQTDASNGDVFALFPPRDDATVSASFVDIRWNSLGVGGPELVWQVLQSSQRSSVRFPDLPPPPSLLSNLDPPTSSDTARGDIDRALHATYAIASAPGLKAARLALAGDLFHGTLPGPPVLPRGVPYRSAMTPGRFQYE